MKRTSLLERFGRRYNYDDGDDTWLPFFVWNDMTIVPFLKQLTCGMVMVDEFKGNGCSSLPRVVEKMPGFYRCRILFDVMSMVGAKDDPLARPHKGSFLSSSEPLPRAFSFHHHIVALVIIGCFFANR
jgi:hypothetical protein